MSEQRPVIVAEGLHKIFGPQPKQALALLRQGLSKDELFERTGASVAVHDASFRVLHGEIFVVMGLSGSGKSTLLRLINRLIEPTAGKVYIDGRDVTAMDNKSLIRLRRDAMSMVFQSFALMPHLTVLQNAAFGLEIAGVPKRTRTLRARQALEQVGLAPQADSYPDVLSGGMQQRVGLARALATDPKLLLMDEAFSALDPLIRADMQEQLMALQREQARTIVFISHDLDEAMKIGDRIAIMEGGRLLQVGTPEEILKHPADPYVRAFFGGVDSSSIYTAGDLARRRAQGVLDRRVAASARMALQRLRSQDQSYGYVCGDGNRFIGVVSIDSLLRALREGHAQIEAALVDTDALRADAAFDEVLRRVAHRDYPVPVVDAEGRFVGTVSKTLLLESLEHREVPATANTAAADPHPGQGRSTADDDGSR